MKKSISLLFLFAALTLQAQVKFENYFYNKTMRLDYYETGNADSSFFSFDELIEEPVWGGPVKNLVDTLEYGYYYYKVFSIPENVEIYSRGYSTLFMEWQTTGEADNISRTYNGSIIFPFPKDSVRVEIYKRNKQNQFVKEFEMNVDPHSYFVRQERQMEFESFKVHDGGDPSECYDIVFLPEGYTAEEMDKFRKDCQQFSEYLFKYQPYEEYKNRINTWGVLAPSEESGADIPGDSVWKKTVLNSTFYTFDSERYLMTEDFQRVRDVAANAPYDQIYILANTDKYGGGAIYNFYSLTAVNNPQTERIFIHELGHGLAGLADEYYTSDVAYEDYYPSDIEPWEPNITTLVNFESKWKNLLDEDTPVPTEPQENYKDKIGVFEGAGYAAKGVYRSSFSSIMITLSADGYNEVSKETIRKVLNSYTK